MTPMEEKQARASVRSASAAVVSAVIALASLAATVWQGRQIEHRERAAEERMLEAERQAHASKVVFHVEAVGDPNVSKKVQGGVQVVANFGEFPIEDASIEEPETIDLGGDKHELISVIRMGTIGPCERAFANTDQTVDGYVVFTDINGITWSRKPASMPVRGRLAEGPDVNSEAGVEFKLEPIKNCQR